MLCVERYSNFENKNNAIAIAKWFSRVYKLCLYCIRDGKKYISNAIRRGKKKSFNDLPSRANGTRERFSFSSLSHALTYIRLLNENNREREGERECEHSRKNQNKVTEKANFPA